MKAEIDGPLSAQNGQLMLKRDKLEFERGAAAKTENEVSNRLDVSCHARWPGACITNMFESSFSAHTGVTTPAAESGTCAIALS